LTGEHPTSSTDAAMTTIDSAIVRLPRCTLIGKTLQSIGPAFPTCRAPQMGEGGGTPYRLVSTPERESLDDMGGGT
jgi:hypothetical protein